MSGFAGILGDEKAPARLVEVLSQIDPDRQNGVGLAVMNLARIDVRRAAGTVDDLRALLDVAPVSGRTGLGQTLFRPGRAPDEAEIHPQSAGRVAVAIATDDDRNPASSTQDTSGLGKTLAQVCDSHLRSGRTPVDAVSLALSEASGQFSAAFMFQDQPDLLVCAQVGVPVTISLRSARLSGPSVLGGADLIVGAGLDAIPLKQGDLAIVTRRDVAVRDSHGDEVNYLTGFANLDGACRAIAI